MRRLLAALILAITFAANAQDTLKLRVMTFNLRFGERATNEQIASLIKRYNPDFVALQEINVMTERVATPHQNGRNMLSEIAAATGMFGFYAKTIDFAGGYYGIGILSKYPPIRAEKTMLPNPKNSEQRALAEGLFEIKGDTIVFASTHLDHTDEQAREIQAKTIAGHFNSYKYPIILGGDFNTGKKSGVIATFSKSGWKEMTGEAPTFPAQNPVKKLDYILTYPSGNWKTTEPAVVKTDLSDHLPVITEVTLIPGK